MGLKWSDKQQRVFVGQNESFLEGLVIPLGDADSDEGGASFKQTPRENAPQERHIWNDELVEERLE